MADQFGRAVTYTSPVSSDHREILAAMYAFWDSGADPNWQIKAGVTVSPPVTDPGDRGFVITGAAGDAVGVDVAFADHAYVGGLMVNGTAIVSSYDMMVGIDPSGGITDITSAGFSVGPRWSGWAANAEGVTYPSHSGRGKLSSSDTDGWVCGRFKASTSYPGGFYAGGYARTDNSVSGGGFAVFSGDFDSWDGGVVNGAIEIQEGVWLPAGLLPASNQGLIGDFATDGVGNFSTVPIAVVSANGSVSPSLSTSVYGILKPIFASANGTTARQWTDSGANVVGYNPDGGCWVCRDDGTDAE